MGWWLTALGHVLWHDLRPFAYLALGAAIGATLGSLGRWFSSRWQIGFVVGIGSALLLYILIFWRVLPLILLHNQLTSLAVRHYRPAAWLITGNYLVFGCLLLAAQAVVGSFLTSVALSLWIPHAVSPRVIAFRQRPWAWWKPRLAMPLLVLLGVAGGWAWYAAHAMTIAWTEDRLRCTHVLPRLKQSLEPFGATVMVQNNRQDALSIELETLPTLPESVLQELGFAQCPLEIYLFSRQIQDGDLARLAGHLGTTKYIYLRCSQVTDAGLLELARCPSLKHISIIDCDSVTRDGIERFHTARTDVKINADNGTDVVGYTP